jgi:hypothetical protein
MRTLAASAFFLLMLFKLQAQPISNVRVTLPQKLPANTGEWNNLPQPIIISAQARPVQGRIPPEVAESRVLVTIENNGAKICGSYTQSNAPMSSFTTPVKTWTGAQAVALLGQECTLPAGDYQLCVVFWGSPNPTVPPKEISEKKCIPFTIAGSDSYTAPALINPEDEKKFREEELMRPVTFRWTPLVPKPRDVVTYRLRVWQLMQGQNGTSAMRTNQPIVTKDVDNITQAIVNAILTGPCKPPYLCDFVWNVQALTRDGKPIGSNNGTSETYRFGIQEAGSAKPPALRAPVDNSSIGSNNANAISFRWTPLVPKPRDVVTYRLRVWQLMQGQNSTQAMRTNKPIVVKDVADITEATVSGIYTGPCKPPYLCDYIWNVQALDRTGKPVGENEGTSETYRFGIQEAGSAKPPTLLAPANSSSIGANDAKKEIKFRWTPLVPKPVDVVTYRLRVWQLMQGQNGTQAMRTNKPIVVKDVADITEATVSGIYTGPCRPPYLCDYIWNVQALDRTGKPIGESEGTSESFAFAVTQYIIQLDSIKVNCTATPGVYSFSYTITNPNAGTALLNAFVATSSVPAGASIGTFAPPLNTPISSGSSLTITGTINAASNLSNICIGAEIKDQVNNFWKASKDTCINVAPCKCEDCDEKHFTLNVPIPGQINWSNNTLSFNQPITITTTPVKTIKSVTADLVYYELVPENDLCIPCNKDAATYGHFGNGTNTQQWISSQTNQNLSLTITTPEMVPCCKAKFRWCIRYKVEFIDCTSCNKLVCYEKEKAGCDQPNANNPK